MDETDQDRIITILRTLAGFRGLTMAEIAQRMGVKQYHLSNRMTGRSTFTVKDLSALADVLDVDRKVWMDEPKNALSYLRTGSRSTPATAEVQPLPRPVAGDEGLAVAI